MTGHDPSDRPTDQRKNTQNNNCLNRSRSIEREPPIKRQRIQKWIRKARSHRSNGKAVKAGDKKFNPQDISKEYRNQPRNRTPPPRKGSKDEKGVNPLKNRPHQVKIVFLVPNRWSV